MVSNVCPDCTFEEQEPRESRLIRGMREIKWYECSSCGTEWRTTVERTVTSRRGEPV